MTLNNKTVIFLLFMISIIGSQCSNTHKSTSQRKMYKSIYVDQFKLTYFRQMLIKGYNNSKAVREIIDFDQSGFTEIILTTDDYKLIDSLTNADNQKLKLDSIARIGRVAEGAEGKHILGLILEKLENKWLDSLAKARYKNSELVNPN